MATQIDVPLHFHLSLLFVHWGSQCIAITKTGTTSTMAPSSFLALSNNPILLLLLLASLPSRHDAFSTSLIRVEPWQQGGGISARISVTIASRSTVSLSASTSDDGGEDEEHLRGIGVGIDLGTTNSAVAMMVPTDADDNDRDGGGRYVFDLLFV